jgi:hypothetical protein
MHIYECDEAARRLAYVKPVASSRRAASPPCGISLEPKTLATGPRNDLSFLSPRVEGAFS